MGLFKKLARWIGHVFRRFTDKASVRYYEGPTPPLRLIQAVDTFALMYPHATKRQWMQFAARHAGEAYKTGYIRGLEWKERAPEYMEPSTAWDVIDSDTRDPQWSWADLAPGEEEMNEIVANNQDAIERLSPEERVLYEDMIGQQLGSHRIVLVPTDDPKQR